jgi:type I restriction enzyme S subunit
MGIDLPVGWLATTLGKIANWGSGGTPSRSRPEFFRGAIPWVKTGELGDKYIRGAEERISEAAVAQSSAKVFPKGAVGIAMYGATIGKLSIWDIDAATNQACAVGVCGAALSNEFLYYFLASEKRNLVKAGKGGAQPNISQGIIKEWAINLPPLAEQHRIVAKIEELFSELDQGVASLKTAREQLKVYRQSLLKNAFEGKLTAAWRADHADQLETAAALQQRIARERTDRYRQQLADWEASGEPGPKPRPPKPLPPLTPEELAELPELPEGWGWCSLGSSCYESVLGKMLDKAKNKGELKPYLRNVNVRWGRFDLNGLLEMRFEAGESQRYSLLDGDLVICEGGEPGRSAVWKEFFSREIYVQKALHRVRFTEAVNPYFVQLFFEFSAASRQLEQLFTGTTIKHLTGEKLAQFPVPLCCTAEQSDLLNILESKLSEADQLDQTLATALQQAEALRQSILKKAFCGQLVKQEKNDEPASALLERIRAEKSNGMKKVGKIRKPG